MDTVTKLLNCRDELVALIQCTKDINRRATEREKMFNTVYAAWKIGELNPMRQYLGLPMLHECEDCGGEHILIPHGKSLLCIACYAEREAFLNDCYDYGDAQRKAKEDPDSVYDRERDRRMLNGE